MSSTYLLDTCTLLWAVDDDKRLSRKARRILSNPHSDLVISVVSLWEIVLKNQVAKLETHVPIAEFLTEVLGGDAWRVLLVTPVHLTTLCDLPMLHRDPFDRLLAAQAKAEGMTLVTCDEELSKYAVTTVW